ncbi:hypothetical protein [Amphibacillus cookii]|uniref:hypothetical protein n=1 Tax=Amphibacillus cookii TaxID=767787 RepID=UPI00195E5753|nr:hypothetical protein [Amphibacillus cookii]MBM7543246.1 Mg/Co/Ni transporter MgtE [Amphibacillus cookii]
MYQDYEFTSKYVLKAIGVGSIVVALLALIGFLIFFFPVIGKILLIGFGVIVGLFSICLVAFPIGVIILGTPETKGE